jgi:NADPH-dependent 2,4-dienoyl-CoA reductase/sulfur reductase-like enzyme
VSQRVVIAGAGMGGLRTAEALRKAGFTGEVVMVGAEPRLPYNRPPLSKEVLAGDVAHSAVAFPLRASVADVHWRLGVPAVSVDLDARVVCLGDGTSLEYDGLVIATGLRPRRLDVPGPPPTAAAGRHAVRTLDDAAALRAALRPGATVVVLGAGFIGCEVAATARGLGCEVTCAAIDPLPMVRPLGTLLGAELKRRHEQRGVRFALGLGVTQFLGTDRVTGVELSDGRCLAADLVVEAISSDCNTEWLADAGLDLTDGVLVDHALRACRADGSPVEGVHAVGDLARFANPRFDAVPRRVEHWNIPTETARRVGPVLAGWLRGTGDDAPRFAPLPAFWSDQYDIRLQSYGLPGLADDVKLLEGDLEGEAVVGYRRDGELVGVVGLGMLPRVNAYRAFIGASPGTPRVVDPRDPTPPPG